MCSEFDEIKKPDMNNFFRRFNEPSHRLMSLLIYKIQQQKLGIDECKEFFFPEEELVEQVARARVFFQPFSFESFISKWLKRANFWNYELRKRNKDIYVRWNWDKRGCEVRLNVSLFRFFWWLAQRGGYVSMSREEFEKLQDEIKHKDKKYE